MDVVARSDELPLFDAMRRIRAQPTALSVEAELKDCVRARVIFGRLQHVVLDPGDVRHESEPIGRIGRDRMRADRGLLFRKCRRADGAVSRDRMHRDIAALVIGAKHVAAGAVRRQEGRRVRLGCGPRQRDAAARGIDPVARDRWPLAMADIKRAAVRTDRHNRRPAACRHIGPLRQRAALAIQSEDRDFVVILQADVQHVHCSPSSSVQRRLRTTHGAIAHPVDRVYPKPAAPVSVPPTIPFAEPDPSGSCAIERARRQAGDLQEPRFPVGERRVLGRRQ